MKKNFSKLKEGLENINSGNSGISGLIKSSTPEQSPSKYGRMCAVVNIELQLKLQEIAHRNRLTFKQVLEEAMAKAVQAYEAKNGEIQVSRQTTESKDLF